MIKVGQSLLSGEQIIEIKRCYSCRYKRTKIHRTYKSTAV